MQWKAVWTFVFALGAGSCGLETPETDSEQGAASDGGAAHDVGSGASSDGGSYATGGSQTGGGTLSGDGGTPSGAGGSFGGAPPMDDPQAGPDPIGEGWQEYQPEWTYHVPPNADEYGERYTYEDGVFHLWVKDTDLSSFPGQDSGPRSEVRLKNEYVEGEQQFQADFLVESGAEKVGIWQVFQRPYPWMIRIYDGEFRQFGNGSTFSPVEFGKWQRLHIIHRAESRKLQIYLDDELVLDTTISESDGSVDFYNKFGVYGREGMGELNEIYFKNVHVFKKD